MTHKNYRVKIWRWNRWLLLLLIIPLLFIPLKKDIQVMDRTTTSSAQFVNFEYKKAFLYHNDDWFDIADDTLKSTSVSRGIYTFKDVEYSVFSLLFFHFSKCSAFNETKCGTGSTGKYLFHYVISSDTLELHRTETLGNIEFMARDANSNNLLENVRVDIRYVIGDSVFQSHTFTNSNGIAAFFNVPYCSTIQLAKGSKEDYFPDSLINKPVEELSKHKGYNELRLIPIQKCNTRTAEDQPGESLYVSQFDLGSPKGSFVLEYFTDTQADKIEVFCGSDRIFTYDDATNSRSEKVELNFSAQFITVKVTGDSNWWYQVNCPD
jgi:hypothetical protein